MCKSCSLCRVLNVGFKLFFAMVVMEAAFDPELGQDLETLRTRYMPLFSGEYH